MTPELLPDAKNSVAELALCDPGVKLGQPVIANTGLLVDELLKQLAGASNFEEVLSSNPKLSLDGIRAALDYAADLVRQKNSLDHIPTQELHGAHPVTLPPSGTETEKQAALAVRTYQPEASAVDLIRLPKPPVESRSWFPVPLGEEAPAQSEPFPVLPMERIHAEGVFEVILPGETEAFPYRLSVTQPDGTTHTVETAYRFEPSLQPEMLSALAPAKTNQEEDPLGPTPACQLHAHLGAHPCTLQGVAGVRFAVWAPNASQVCVVGDFNAWDGRSNPMRPVGETGVWELFIPGLLPGMLYKYRITGGAGGPAFDKADPFAFHAQVRPETASVIYDLGHYTWGDAEWMQGRAEHQNLQRPLAVYEVHLGSWKRPSGKKAAADTPWYSYRELAEKLIPYVKEMGYTHVELLPVTEHPYDGSWGYQVTGFFAPTSRFGTPDDFRHFVDTAHKAGIGVIIDWVPGHFPKDAHGLARFDGTCLFEHEDPRRSEIYEWGTLSFNLERDEVSAFLLSNAFFWIEQYHVDGLRVDAVSSMLYLDYSRQHWLPNEQGGRENLQATAYFRRLNRLVHEAHPGVLMIAEESTAWPKVTGRDASEGLGFDLKWNMGWMHDTLGYAQKDPVHRSFHHKDLTFSMVYAFSENFILPFSHDEVVHGKRSMLSKMPGDKWQRFATLRAVYGYMYAHPGKKLHFMGDEFGALREWNENTELEWSLLRTAPHKGLKAYVRELNRLYVQNPALHEVDVGWEGFQWLDCDDAARSTLSFLRRSRDGRGCVAFVANFTPVPREQFRLGVPVAGDYRELLNSDDKAYGGSGITNTAEITSEPVPAHGQAHSILVTLPPLAAVYYGLK